MARRGRAASLNDRTRDFAKRFYAKRQPAE